MTAKDNQKSDIKLLPAAFLSHVDEITREMKNPRQQFGLIQVRTANKTMEDAALQPIPKMLFDEFWHEGELATLFADTGVGKSILGTQIGESIASGKPIPGFSIEASAQPVYYFDLELSDKQFQNRYSKDYTDNYTFSDNLYRCDMTLEEIPYGERFESYFNNCFEKAIETTGAKIIIIDNLTRITSRDTDQAKDAKPMMEYLLRLKKKYCVSILALEHTRKRDESREITLNDLQGSAMKIRFVDAAFSIGRSATNPNLRYLVQQKERAKERKFDRENVAVCRITKPKNFTGFEFIEFGTEREHLRQISENQTEQRIALACELKRQGKNNCEIAREMRVSEGAVRKWFKNASDYDIG